MKAAEMLAELRRIVEDGGGDRKVKLMVVEDGVTFAEPVKQIFASQPYDGDLVWIITGERQAPAWAENPAALQALGPGIAAKLRKKSGG